MFQRSPTPYLAVAALAFALLLLNAGAATGTYALNQASLANSSMIAIAPFVALNAALEMAVLRTVWGQLRIERSWHVVLGHRLWLTLLLGVVLIVVLYIVTGGLHWPGWQFPLLSLVQIATWTAVGAALGLAFSRYIALPAALLLPYFVLTFPAAWEPLWLRHLNGNLFDCCSTSAVLDERALFGSIAFLSGLLVVALVIARIRLAPAQDRPVVPALAVLLVVIALPFATAPAQELGALPTQTRAVEELRCEQPVCLWPEDERYRQANRQAWATVAEQWLALELPLPTTSIAPVRSAQLLPLAVATEDPSQALASMTSLLPRVALGCEDNYDDVGRNDRLQRLELIFAQVVGGGGVPNSMERAEAAELWANTPGCQL